MTIGATWSKDEAESTGSIVGNELCAAGVNMLLGPVVDVLANPRSGGNGDIGIRSFGGNPTWVGELGRAYVRGVHDGSAGRMLTVAKHFPGHGGSDRSHRQRGADRQQVARPAPRHRPRPLCGGRPPGRRRSGRASPMA